MKRSDLRAGEIYAVRRSADPCLLLSTDIHTHRVGVRNPEVYTAAAPGTKPRRDRSSLVWGQTSHGFIMLEGDLGALAKVDVAHALDLVLSLGRAGTPGGTSIRFVTESAAILGPYAEHQAHETARREAQDRQVAREIERFNAAVDGLNAFLGDKPLDRAFGRWSPPADVRLTLEQAEELGRVLARLLNATVPASRSN